MVENFQIFFKSLKRQHWASI